MEVIPVDERLRRLTEIFDTSDKLNALDRVVQEATRPRRLVVGITGASMIQYGIRTVEVLAEMPGIEPYVIVTSNSRLVFEKELHEDPDKIMHHIKDLTGHTERNKRVFGDGDLDGPFSSGSFITEGLLIAPCSVNTMVLCALGLDSPAIVRAYKVCLKENRRTRVIMFRETPLDVSMLENLLKLAREGAVILPPMPAYYNEPHDLQAIIDHGVGKALDQFGIYPPNLYKRWETPQS